MSFRDAMLLVAAWCIGCSAGDADLGWAGSVADSAGVTIVSNPEQEIWSTGNGWTVEQDLVIGEVEGNPDYLFGRIAGICVDSGRNIYVLDAQAARLAVYDAGGVFQHAFGESGAGPGELGASVGPCLIGPDDTITIPDNLSFHVTRFTSGGSLVESVRLDMQRGMRLAWRMMGDGRLARQVRALDARLQPVDGAPDVVITGTLGDSASDTLLTFLPGKTLAGADRGRITFFSPEPSWDIASDGHIVFGRGDDYRIELRDPEGNLTRIVTKPFNRVPVEDAEQQAVREALADALGDYTGDVSQFLQFSEFYPAFHRLRSGPRGSLWVQHVISPRGLAEAERGDLATALSDLGATFFLDPRLALESREWDVFDAEGRFLGVVTLPARFTLLAFVDDAIYGVWKNELDVEHVMRLQVVIPE